MFYRNASRALVLSHGLVYETLYAVEHLADALRYITLYRYGGYYFDLDVIIMRSLAGMRLFSLANRRHSYLSMHFDYGHPVIVALVEELRVSYKYKISILRKLK